METVFEGIPVTKRKPLREEVYQSLRKSILQGKLKPGQRLIEEKFAHEAGISRTPVREAFYELERDDLVARRTKGGFVVRQFTREDVEEILGIRCALESYAAYLATPHMRPDRMATLEKKVDESEKALKGKDLDKLIQLHTEFHNLLYKSAKSKKLLQMINDYSDYFYRYRVALLRGNRNIEYVPEDHRRMLKAMKKKSPRVVERLVRNHLEKTKQILLKSIDEGKIIP